MERGTVMKALRISTITLAVLASLCMSAVSVATAQQEAEPAQAPEPGVPFAGVFSGSVSFEPQEVPTEACPLPVKTITDASGSTTVGDVTLHAEHCPTVGLPTVPVGSQTLTTEDGDEISGVYFVDCDPVMPSAESGEAISCLGRFQITGGTGEFAQATGSASEVAYVWFPGSMDALEGWLWVSKMEGAIDY